MVLDSYVGGLTCTQGHGRGDPLKVLPWERRFLKGAFGPDVSDVGLSLARGNGKTTLCAAVATSFVDPDGPLEAPAAEVAVVSHSHGGGKLVFRHVVRFLVAAGHDLTKRGTWRKWDTPAESVIECKATGTVLVCLGSDPETAQGLAPALVLADEPASWKQADAMRSALRTALGKIPGSRIVALGTRSKDPGHWFEKLLNGGADYAQMHAAPEKAPPFQRRTWLRANPSLPIMPGLEKEIRAEAADAKRDPAELASFRAKRLNQGVSEVLEATLLDAGAWEACETREAPLRAGPCAWGLDLGSTAAMSAVAAYWPATGALEVLAAFPAEPSLAARGLRDGVGPLYHQMHERGELALCGRHTVNVPGLVGMALERFGAPSVLASDRWREGELREALQDAKLPRAPLVLRGQGFKDGGEDLRSFRRKVGERQVRAPVSLLLRSALAEARAVTDTAGNSKLSKKTEGGRRAKAKDDAAAASILAVSTGARQWPDLFGQEAPRRRGRRVSVGRRG